MDETNRNQTIRSGLDDVELPNIPQLDLKPVCLNKIE